MTINLNKISTVLSAVLAVLNLLIYLISGDVEALLFAILMVTLYVGNSLSQMLIDIKKKLEGDGVK